MMTNVDKERMINLLEENNKLLKENNIMLRQIIAYINSHGNHTDDMKEFTMNVVANLLSGNR